MALSTREISRVDIKTTESNLVQYSSRHVKHVPPGTITDFKWKDYCPSVFRHIQELENIDQDDYMLSVCSDETLRKASSGKPGNLFLLSKDDRFVIKILRKSEVKVILDMLPNYYCHLKKYQASLLNKMYGAHVVKPAGGPKVYFAVTSNILDSNVFMYRCYDLKGSSRGRNFNRLKLREKTLLKDSDLDFCFYLDPLTRHRLLAQIKFDCEFLAAEGIMDYSLLLGVHIKSSLQGPSARRSLDYGQIITCDTAHRRSASVRTSCVTSVASSRGSVDSGSSSLDLTISSDFMLGNEETELTFADNWLQSNRSGFRFGVEMPARAVRKSRNESRSVCSHRSAGTQDCNEVLLYFGIVDIAQNYGMRKRIQHAYKSLQHDSKNISAINPKAYSSRFQEYLGQVFQADDSDE